MVTARIQSLPAAGVAYGFLGTAGVCGGRGLVARALRSAAALAAAALAAAASAFAACSANCGVIQLSIGPRAARHTLPWWPPPGMITNGTLANRVSSSCLKFAAAMISGLFWAPAASQKAGRRSLIGTLVTYSRGVLISCSAGRPRNTLTGCGFAPGLLPSGTRLRLGEKYPDMTPTAP